MRWIAKTTTLAVRPYQASDRDALMKIAADTAFFGEPIEIYLDDRRIFQDYFYAYYTDYEPQHAWVATAAEEDKVVGFLTGCVDTREQQQVSKNILWPRTLWNAIRGKYKLGKKTWDYYRGLRQVKRSGNLALVDLRIYPAHLHINVDKEWRGYGIGRRLMQIYFSQLLELGVTGVHLGTSSENVAACRLYEQMGFKLLAAKPTQQWEALIDHPVETRIYGLELHKESIFRDKGDKGE